MILKFKLFEDIDDDLYKPISRTDYELTRKDSFKSISVPKRNIDKFTTSKIDMIKAEVSSFKVSKKSDYFLSLKSPNLNNVSVLVTVLYDDYYLVREDFGKARNLTIKYYKCDELTGLLNCLESINKKISFIEKFKSINTPNIFQSEYHKFHGSPKEEFFNKFRPSDEVVSQVEKQIDIMENFFDRNFDKKLGTYPSPRDIWPASRYHYNRSGDREEFDDVVLQESGNNIMLDISKLKDEDDLYCVSIYSHWNCEYLTCNGLGIGELGAYMIKKYIQLYNLDYHST